MQYSFAEFTSFMEKKNLSFETAQLKHFDNSHRFTYILAQLYFKITLLF